VKRSTIGTPVADVRLEGEVFSVAAYTLGVTLEAAASAGATSLTVMDPWGLPPFGRLRVEVEEGGAGEEIGYTAIDPDTGVVTLETPLVNAWAAGDWFYLLPVSTIDEEGEPQVQRLASQLFAWVRLSPDDDEPVIARIPANLAAALSTGFQDPPIEATIQRQGDEWVLVDLPTTPASVATDQLVTGGLIVVDPETGETVASITPDGGAFQHLSAENFESPGIPKRNERSMNLYVDAANGDDTNDGQGLPALIDTFTRTVTNPGFGTSDSGHAWGQNVHTGNLQEVNGTDGRIRLNGTSQETIMTVPLSMLDNEMLARVNINQVPGSGGFYGGLCPRMVDSQNCWAVFLQISSAGNLVLEADEQLSNAWTALQQVTIGTGYTTGTLAAKDWFVRCQLALNPEGGTDIRAKAWDATTTEPDAWQVEVNSVTAALQSPARVGVAARSGAAMSSGNPIVSYRELSAYTIDASGFVVDVETEGVGPLATVASALEQVGEWNDGTVRIILTGTVEENIDILGLSGGGSLTIDGGGLGVTTLWGYVRLRNVAHEVNVRAMTIQDTGDPGPAGTISAYGSGYLYVEGVSIQTNGSRANSIVFQYGSRGRVDSSEVHGATSRGIYSVNVSVCYLSNNAGSGAPVSYQASAAQIHVNGSKPSNATNTTLSGQIFGTTGSNSGGSAPTPSTKKTTTVTCNATKSWRGVYDPPWRSGDDAIQGSYGGSANSRGFFFYGAKCEKPGRSCDSIKVTLKRQSTGGASGKAGVYLWLHGYKSQSDAGTAGAVQEGPVKVGELAWGETKTFSLPVAWGNKLLDGTRRGIVAYVQDGNPYVWLAGRGGNTNQGKLVIVHH
jgi:hypothetical protein